MIYNESKFNENWNIKFLYQLGEFNRGKSKYRPRNDKSLFTNGTYPLIQTGEVKNANFIINTHNAMYNDFGLQQSKLWPKGTLCITIAANIAETAILGYPMCFPDSIVGFNAYEEETTNIYMHYIFSFIKKAIQTTSRGSIQDNINIDYLKRLKFRIPEKKYQEKICEVLSLIDYKIELNKKINKSLDSIMNSIYDYWYIQYDFPDLKGNPYNLSGGEMVYNSILKREIPKQMQVLKLDSEIEFQDGNEPGTDKYYVNNMDNLMIPFYRVGNIEGRDYVFVKKADYSYVKPRDILISFDGSVGKIGVGLEGYYSTGVKKVIDKNDKFGNAFLYCLFSSDEYQKTIKKYADGSIIKHASESINYLYIQYDKNLLEKFKKICDPIFDSIVENIKQNRALIELRDWLLPMLMSGQIKIDTIK